jgi:DNA-binding MarR family transcriptional regulator
MADGTNAAREERSAAIDAIQADLTTITRRGSVRTRRAHPDLTLASQSLISYIEAHPGCRAVDVAAHFELDKSTVSRQLGVLLELGFIARENEGPTSSTPGGAAQRGQGLVLTEHGKQAEARLSADVSEALAARLADWPQQDVTAFASLLHRFNTGEEGSRLD